MKNTKSSSLEGEGVLARNTLINFAGQAVPLLFAAAAIPFVIDGLGTARFGVLTIVWIIIGYFGLFDMGIGRATTKFVADLEAKGSRKLTPFIFTSILLLIGLGVAGSLLIYFLTPLLVNRVLNVPPDLQAETIGAFRTLSISIPFVLGSVGARGALEARQRFGIVNAIKIPASIINYISPLLILPFTNQLPPVVTVLVIARCATFFLYAYYSLHGNSRLSLSDFPVFRWIKELISFGAWIMVSNFISPIMVYVDRFILGAILTMSAVAYYTTPYEVVTRLLVIAGSFMGVMFPAFSVYSLSDKENLAAMHRKSIRYLLFVLIPITVFLVIVARPLLFLWLGEEFAVNSARVMRWLAVGVLFNSVAMVPYTALQAIGRPDITAKLHMVELPVYLGLIWWLTYRMGIEGAALAWVLRVAIDCGMLFYFSDRFIGFFSRSWKMPALKAAGGVLLLIPGYLVYLQLNGIFPIIIYAVLSALFVCLLSWKYILAESEREKIVQLTGDLNRRFRT